MAVSKLADLVIIAVKYRIYRGNPRIWSAQISPEHSRLVVPGGVVGREGIASAIREGYSVITGNGAGASLVAGQRVHVVQNGMYYFIRVDNLPVMADDLGVVRRI